MCGLVENMYLSANQKSFFMQDNRTPAPPPDPWTERIRSMNRDLEFITRLLGAPIYKGQSPNLFERLQEFRTEVAALQNSLGEIDSNQPGELQRFEKHFSQWKHGVYEFVESNL